MAEDEENDKKKKKKNSKYNYSFGDVHPGVTIGHKYCNPFLKPGYPVPAEMGWLWTANDVPGLKVRKGWQPGLIGKTMTKLMTFKCARPDRDKQNSKKKKRHKGGQGAAEDDDSEPEEPLTPKPALRVQRKGDVFTIQVAPLKDLKEISPNENPYVNCDPLVFKIIKKRSPEEAARIEAKKIIRLKKQRDAEVRKALAEAVEDICKCAYMDVYCNDLTAIDKVIDGCPAFKDPGCLCEEESLSSLSSNATWDIEYTPPFGCFDLSPRKRNHFVHTETQYQLSDIGLTEPPKTCRRRSCVSLCKTKSFKKSTCCMTCR